MDSSDKEVLRRVYQAQMDQWRQEHGEAVRRRTEAGDRLVQIQADYFEAHGDAERLVGKMQGLKMLAKEEGVELR